MATQSIGISARQLWRQLRLGSYKSAGLLRAKLRRAMVDPDLAPLAGLVEMDETAITYRTKDDPPASGHGRSRVGKMPLASAVEIISNGLGRARLAVVEDYSATSLHALIRANTPRGRHRQNRRLVRLPRRAGRRPQPTCRRQNGCPRRPLLDPSRLRQP